MKRILLSLVLSILLMPRAYAGDGDQFFTFNAGLLFQNTLNTTFGYEKELPYDNALELFGEAGNRWERDPECGKVCSKSFWKHYYWNGGIVYKKSLIRWKNSTLRLDVGPVAGAYRGDYFFGAEGGLRIRVIRGAQPEIYNAIGRVSLLSSIKIKCCANMPGPVIGTIPICSRWVMVCLLTKTALISLCG